MQMGKMDFLAFFFCDKKQKSQGNWLFNGENEFCVYLFGKGTDFEEHTCKTESHA
ncbi:hypothetical protein HNQ34_003159 [Anoxybacillus tepidamans]|uniref:Uncharacterized protein n=1 Tax=Anoxybacteroides tepidamans TaxID=265948 RepID=A0A7W8IUB8_9BACL|nr:hypothetical protein [Anoxybacillus tepidamans]